MASLAWLAGMLGATDESMKRYLCNSHGENSKVYTQFTLHFFSKSPQLSCGIAFPLYGWYGCRGLEYRVL
jgi:hypothetical protein